MAVVLKEVADALSLEEETWKIVWHQQGRAERMSQAVGTVCTQTMTLWLPLYRKCVGITILAVKQSPSSRPDLVLTALHVFSWSFLTKPPRVGTLNVHQMRKLKLRDVW